MPLTTVDKIRIRTAIANKGTADNLIDLLDSLSPAEIEVLDGITPGTALASKAIVLGASKEISVITTAGITNVDVGASGTAGTLDVFPSTASKGKIAITATANTNNDTISITNAAMGQATALTIPDPGAASASFVLTVGTQAISGARTYSGGVTIATTALTITDVNIVLSATTGTKIGTATTQKLGFFNATPIAQPSAYTQTYATADKTHANPTAAVLTVSDGAGTNDGTIGAITADASVIAAVQELAAQINKLVADDADTKQLLNAVIDDLQALGLLS